MNTKYTPGPWTLDLEYIGFYIENHVSINAPSHSGIANVVWVMADDAHMGKNSPNCEANARLIAESPVMFDLLQKVLPLVAFAYAKGHADAEIIGRDIEAAISKVKGETK